MGEIVERSPILSARFSEVTRQVIEIVKHVVEWEL